MKTVLCIPTYKERDNIDRLIPRILKIFSENAIDGFILVIDDNSPDGTADIVKMWMNKDQRVKLLSRTKKAGLGSAYRAGFQKAKEYGADIIFEMDADFSHDPNMIPIFLQKIQSADLVIGSRKVGQGGGVTDWSFTRRLISWGANTMTHVFLGLKTKDITSGYRAIRTKVLDSVDLGSMKTEGYAFQLELLYLIERIARKRVVEIPIIFTDRRIGQSKLGISDILEFALQVFRLMFVRK